MQVQAVNAQGASDWSASAPDTPPAAPSPAVPPTLLVTRGDTRVTLHWGSVSDATITRWEYRQKAGAGDYEDWTGIPGSAADTRDHEVTGLSNGTRYTFQVRALRGGVPGAASNEASATPTPPLAQPTDFTATPGDSQVILRWAGPSDPNIVSWEYRQKAADNYGGWAEIAGSNATTRTHTVTGLKNGTRYTFRVRALSGAVPGPVSAEASATPTAQKPDAPGTPSGPALSDVKATPSTIRARPVFHTLLDAACGREGGVRERWRAV